MASFYKYQTKEQALRALTHAVTAQCNFRRMCVERGRDEETFFTLAQICAMLSLSKEKGDEKGLKHWNGKLRDFIRGFEPYAKRLSKWCALQSIAISEAVRLGATQSEMRDAIRAGGSNG